MLAVQQLRSLAYLGERARFRLLLPPSGVIERRFLHQDQKPLGFSDAKMLREDLQAFGDNFCISEHGAPR